MGSVSAKQSADARSVPFLVFTDANETRRLFVLAPGLDSASVGRRPPSDVLLDWDDQVSRAHARFERAGEAWELVDDGLSRNGTFVNGERLSGRCRLSDGDRLRFGNTTVTFRAPASASAAVGLSTTQRRVLEALCRPYKASSASARPAADAQIAQELFLSVGEVQAHLKVLGVKLGLDGPAPGEQRILLVERALSAGLVSEAEF